MKSEEMVATESGDNQLIGLATSVQITITIQNKNIQLNYVKLRHEQMHERVSHRAESKTFQLLCSDHRALPLRLNTMEIKYKPGYDVVNYNEVHRVFMVFNSLQI